MCIRDSINAEYMGIQNLKKMIAESVLVKGNATGAEVAGHKDEEKRKKAELLKDFEASGKMKDQRINLAVLIDHIEKKMQEISRNESYQLGDGEKQAIGKIFSSLDKSNRKTITVQEFVNGVIDNLAFCKAKQTELQKKNNDIKAEIADLNKQKTQEEANIGSFQRTLKIWVKEAKNLPPMDVNGLSDPYTIVTYASQAAKTRIIKNTLNPNWNEVFSFTVIDEKEKIHVAVWDEDTIKKDDFEGTCELEIPDPQTDDQTMKTEWKVLYDEESRETTGKINIGLQYIYDLSLINI
eukprot:TRINITY_DN2539_c0_g1_i1.p1 TRINITY_DN2539_c0_g1~~TRINITY_DN2539_c0_g1_i1.p1  ORF type:complete len:295 (+),score=88.38 TRINITY_DN2539_c0_g1_i1:63-947(+)